MIIKKFNFYPLKSMKKIFKKLFAGIVLLFLLTVQTGYAATAPNYWKKSGDSILLINPAWDLGSVAQPIPTIYADNLVISGGSSTDGNLEVEGDIKTISISAPAAPVVALASPASPGNVDNGDHRYKITYLTLIGETEASTATGAVTVADKTVNGRIVLTLPTSNKLAVLQRKIYRQFNGTGDYKFVATVNDNTTTTYTDNIANSSLGAAIAPIANTTGTIYGEGGIQAPGSIAIGNEAVIANDRNVDYSREITSFGLQNQYNQYSETILNPSSTVGTGNESFVASENLLEIPSGNTQDFNLANFSNGEFFVDHNGSGDIGAVIALWGAANNNNSGNFTYELIAGYFTSYNNGSGTIEGDCFKCGNFAVAAGTGNRGSGTIEADYTYYAETPWNDLSGPILKHWGMYMEDQEIGTESWAIQTHGGKVEFGSPTGKNSLFYLSDDDVAQPITSIQPAAVYSKATAISSTAGGLLLTGISDADAQPFKLGAYFGSANPTDATSALTLDVGKSDGATGIDPLGAAETAYQITNDGNSLFTVLGDGTSTFLDGAGNTLATLTDGGTAGNFDVSGTLNAGTSDAFQVSAAGTVTIAAGQSYTSAGAVTYGSGSNGNLNIDANGSGDINVALDTAGGSMLNVTGSSGFGGVNMANFQASSSSSGNLINFTLSQSDDADASDVTSGLILNINSNSGDADELNAIKIANLTAGTALENGLNIGTGWDYGLLSASPVLVTNTNAAGGSASSLQITPTLGIMDGSDLYTGLNIDIANANHTGTDNNVRGIYIDGITFDGQATASAIEIGAGGWNYGLVLPTNIGIKLGTADFYYDGTDLNTTDGLVVGGPLTINNGTLINKHLSEVLSDVTSASISATACGNYASVTVTGAAVGDTVIATPDGDSSATGIEDSDLSWNAYVSATNTVTIRACNPTALAIDAGNDQEWRVDVWQH